MTSWFSGDTFVICCNTGECKFKWELEFMEPIPVQCLYSGNAHCNVYHYSNGCKSRALLHYHSLTGRQHIIFKENIRAVTSQRTWCHCIRTPLNNEVTPSLDL